MATMEMVVMPAVGLTETEMLAELPGLAFVEVPAGKLAKVEALPDRRAAGGR